MGASSLRRRSRSEFRSRIPVVAFDRTAAERFGELRAAVRDRRRDALDRLIAAHADRLDATLVTNNEADFNDFPGLKIENWTRESGPTTISVRSRRRS